MCELHFEQRVSRHPQGLEEFRLTLDTVSRDTPMYCTHKSDHYYHCDDNCHFVC